jgi:hypothetical protein
MSNDDYEKENRRLRLEEALTSVWRTAMEVLERRDVLPMARDLDDQYPPNDPARVVNQIETAIGLLQTLLSRSDRDKAEIIDLRQKLAALSAAYKEVELEQFDRAEKLELELQAARSRAASVEGYKAKLMSLPAEEELKPYVAALRAIADILAPNSERHGYTSQTESTYTGYPKQIVERVREMRYDYRELEKLCREALGIDDYKPVVDTIRALHAAHAQQGFLLDHIRKGLGIDPLAYELSPLDAVNAALKARDVPGSSEEVRRWEQRVMELERRITAIRRATENSGTIPPEPQGPTAFIWSPSNPFPGPGVYTAWADLYAAVNAVGFIPTKD